MASDDCRIECADCVMFASQMPDGCVDLTVTSPPYDNLRSYGGHAEYDFDAIARELYRVTADGGVVVWVKGDQTRNGSESGSSFRQALRFMDIGFRLHDTMIYQKRNYVPLTHRRYEQSFEYMFVLSKGRPKTFNPIMVPCKGAGKVELYGSARRGVVDKSQAMRSPDGAEWKRTKSEKIHPNVFEYSCGSTRSGHPAPFPDRLAEDMVRSWSNVGDLVFDPFLGSGTTARAALSLGRRFAGCDISQEYCDMSAASISSIQTAIDL